MEFKRLADGDGADLRRAATRWEGSFGEEGIRMFVARGATAEENERFAARIPEFVFFAGWDCDGVTGADVGEFAFDAHASGALGNVIDFFGFGVVMLLSARANRKARF